MKSSAYLRAAGLDARLWILVEPDKPIQDYVNRAQALGVFRGLLAQVIDVDVAGIFIGHHNDFHAGHGRAGGEREQREGRRDHAGEHEHRGRERRAEVRHEPHRREEPEDHSYFFASLDGQSLSRYDLLRVILNIGSRAGVPNATVHRFRHTFAISFLRNGGNVYALQAMLGHPDVPLHRAHRGAAADPLEPPEDHGVGAAVGGSPAAAGAPSSRMTRIGTRTRA